MEYRLYIIPDKKDKSLFAAYIAEVHEEEKELKLIELEIVFSKAEAQKWFQEFLAGSKCQRTIN